MSVKICCFSNGCAHLVLMCYEQVRCNIITTDDDDDDDDDDNNNNNNNNYPRTNFKIILLHRIPANFVL